jgi:hypothetical protein
MFCRTSSRWIWLLPVAGNQCTYTHGERCKKRCLLFKNNFFRVIFFFETEAKDLPYSLIKQKRLSSLLMENWTKTITKPLSGAHRILHTHLAKEGLVETSHKRHRHHFSPMKQQLKPTNSEQTTPTSP